MEKKRFKEIDNSLDPSTRMKLDQLQKFLDLRKASVMVGAGFSKNAEMGEGLHMKDWSELCEDLYAVLYNKKPTDSDFRLKSALRLAQQVESTMGRSALDEIIKSSIPNDSVFPGYLHDLLVSLNWRDIFTTNYDTLLEKAAIKTYRHYNVVTSKDSLIYQPHPRIVKLHGSFPDNRPFIITEEDYRTYPEQFPEFVNTIRQALIETQFCLIGFSGDDPNFLNWIGWFRDIMGKQMHPIYMIYVGQRPHDSEIKLFNQRKIEPIITEDISENPKEAIDFILSYIGNRFNEKKKWSGKLDLSHFSAENIKESIEEMRKIRESYPGWIILPVNKIETDFDDCRSDFPFIGKLFLKLENKYKLDFLYEYTWRLQTSFMPSWFDTGWYVNAINEINSKYDTLEALDRGKADYLSIALLQIHRIKDNDKFETELNLFRKRISPSNTFLHHRLNYEESLWAISHCKSGELENVLASWDVTPGDYRSVLWKSKILMEIDKDEEAAKILEISLEDARRRLLLDGESEYLLNAASLISYHITCNVHLNNHCFDIHRNNQYKGFDENFRFIRYSELCKKEIQTEDKHGRFKSIGFNIGTYSTSWYSAPRGYFKKYVGAARYYLIAEAYGQPIGRKLFSYNSEINQFALPLIAEADLKTALSYLVETNDKAALKATFSRREIFKLTEETATIIFDSWIKVLEPYAKSGDDLPLHGRESNVVLPLLARLCVWLEQGRTMQIIKFILNIFDSRHTDLSELLSTCYNSLPKDKAIELWWEIMKQPIILKNSHVDFKKPNIHIKNWQGNLSVVTAIMNGMSNESQDIRVAAIKRLKDIYRLLPIEYQEDIDNTILANFDKLLSTDLISILDDWLKSGEDRMWKDSLLNHIETQVNEFKDTDFIIDAESVTIYEFDGRLAILNQCHHHLTVEQTNIVLQKIFDFINANEKKLYEIHDDESPFGGIKQVVDSAMSGIGEFFAKADCSSIPSSRRKELFDKFILLSERYPLLIAITQLLLANKEENMQKVDKKIRQIMETRLKKAIVSTTYIKMYDAFYAIQYCQRLPKNCLAIQEVVATAIDHVRYFLDSETGHILHLFQIWIENDIIEKQNLSTLFVILSELPARIKDDKDISEELKTNLLYQGGYIAGVISKTEFVDVDKEDCVTIWQQLVESNLYSHDIRNGYYMGAYEAE